MGLIRGCFLKARCVPVTEFHYALIKHSRQCRKIKQVNRNIYYINIKLNVMIKLRILWCPHILLILCKNYIVVQEQLSSLINLVINQN